MIDTIRWRVFGNIYDLDITDLGTAWKVYEGKTYERVQTDEDTYATLPLENIRFLHKETGLRLQGVGTANCGRIETLEVSLPKLLFGQNGRLITDQRQLDESICILRKLLGDVLGAEFTKMTEAHLTRVDLVWQYRRDPAKMIEDLSKVRHPQVRKANRVYQGESVNFPGRERFLRIYDKEKEQKGRRGEVTRIELQLRGKALKDDLARKDRVTIKDLKFDTCYKAYRDFLMRFEPLKKIDLQKTIELLAWAVRNDAKGNDGQMLFDLWAEGKSDRHIRRTRAKIEQVNFKYRQWTFGDLLPEDPKSEDLEVVEVA